MEKDSKINPDEVMAEMFLEIGTIHVNAKMAEFNLRSAMGQSSKNNDYLEFIKILNDIQGECDKFCKLLTKN